MQINRKERGKMEKKQRFAFSTFHKTCLIFLVAVSIHFLGSFILYHEGADMLRREVTLSAENSHKYASQRLKNELNRISTLQTTLNNNWDINRLSLFSDQYNIFSLSEAIGNIEDKLWAVQSSSQFIDSLHVYVPDMDVCIGTYSNGQNLQQQREIYQALSQFPKGKIIYDGERLTFFTESAYASKSMSDRPAFFLQTTFSSSLLKSFLSAQVSSPYENMLVMLSGHGVILSGTPISEDAELYGELLKLPEKSEDRMSTLRLSCDSQTYTVICSRMSPSDLYLIQYCSDKMVNQKLHGLTGMIWLLTAFLLGASLFFSFSIHKIIHIPLNRLVNAYQSVENGDLNTHITPRGQSEFHYLYQGFDRMIERLQESIRQAYQQKELAQKAELKQLQSQIDPHFLYNSFFILNKRIRTDDTEGALRLSQLMGSYFQYITRSGRDFVPLAEELSHAVNYLEIQRIRFQNRLVIQADPLPEDVENCLVPRLILQPICENAIKYAVESRTDGSLLRLYFQRPEEGLLDIVVEDNGGITEEQIEEIKGRLETEDPEEITGLINIHKRLRLCFGERCGILLAQSPSGGLRSTLRIALNGKGRRT